MIDGQFHVFVVGEGLAPPAWVFAHWQRDVREAIPYDDCLIFKHGYRKTPRKSPGGSMQKGQTLPVAILSNTSFIQTILSALEFHQISRGLCARALPPVRTFTDP